MDEDKEQLTEEEINNALQEIHEMVSSTWIFTKKHFKKDDSIRKMKTGGYWIYYKICQKCGRKYYRNIDYNCDSH